MPHKDREKRLGYLRAWKATGRPSPAAQPQSDPSLPARGQVTFSADGERVQCHACGRWLRSLNTHLRMHGLNAETYKETYDLKRTTSLWPTNLKHKQSEAARARDQGAVGREYLPRGITRQKGLANRLGTRIEASEQRKGVYTRGGKKTKS